MQELNQKQKMSNQETTTLYRIENPNITAIDNPDTSNSHPEIVGQWFDPDLDYTANYLPKSTKTYGRDGRQVEGAQLVVARVPNDQLDSYHVSNHPIASKMETEPGNHILPRDGSISMEVIPLDPIIEDLRGKGNFQLLMEARQRIAKLVNELGETAVGR